MPPAAERDGQGDQRQAEHAGAPARARHVDLLARIGQQRTAEAAGAPVGYFSLVRDNPAFDLSDPMTLPPLYREGYVYYTEIAPNPSTAAGASRDHGGDCPAVMT
jgi:uncharacterized protein